MMLSSKIDQMLTFEKKITVSNYAGDAREYIKKLLSMLGASPIPAMRRNDTTLVVAAEFVFFGLSATHSYGA